MSTATQTPTVTQQPITTELYTLARVYQGPKDAEGNWKSISILPEDKAKEMLDKYNAAAEKFAKNEGPEPDEVVIETQSFKTYQAGTLDGVRELVPDENEQVLLFNRGLLTKEQNKARALLKSTDENGDWTMELTEEAHDMLPYCAVPTSRRGANTVEKVNDLLAKLTPENLGSVVSSLSPEQIAAIKAMLGA